MAKYHCGVKKYVIFCSAIVGLLWANACVGANMACSNLNIPVQLISQKYVNPVATLSRITMSGDKNYRAFVTSIAGHIADHMKKAGACNVREKGEKASLIQYLKWELVVSEGEPKYLPVLGVGPARGCRLKSPWLDMAFEGGKNPRVRAIVRWNYRQVLVDQAILHGAMGTSSIPSGAAMPINADEYRRLISIYADAHMGRTPDEKFLESNIPPDVLWLFRRAAQNQFPAFEGNAAESMDIAMGLIAERYTELVKAMVDRCFERDGIVIRYTNILDAQGMVDLGKYRITSHMYYN
ncbi:hypothetical protein [Leeia sp.]|uniref:hypothetical protein n=1 Tax=Leeia sp. TaxID=2884678 RepID=UPI0035AE93A4